MAPVDDPLRISSRQELVEYLESLSEKVSKGEIDYIENEDLPRFIEAAGGWIDDMPNFFRVRGKEMPEAPTWAIIGAIFTAALIYE